MNYTENEIINNWSNVSLPLLSICCITYNHKDYIKDAIEGFLMQKTSFPFEIIIHDDASTDGTTEIIREYEKAYPKIIKGIYQKENQYSKGIKGITARFTFPIAKGKYIALCEGDDYWTDSLKLQKQVGFLENHEDYVISSHNAVILDEENNIIDEKKLPLKFQRDLSKEELMKTTAILTLTAVFRNKFDMYPEILKQSPNGDTAIFSYLGQFGKSKFHDDIKDAMYRIHNGGIWSTKNQLKKNQMQLETYKNLYSYYQVTPYINIASHFNKKILYHINSIVTDLDFWAKINLLLRSLIGYIRTKEYKNAFFISKRMVKVVFCL